MRRMLSLFALLGGLLAPLVAASPALASSTTPISACGFISSPGSYMLTTDLTSPAGMNCINIVSSNVTLNLNGKTITGPGNSSSCWAVTAVSLNSTILNSVTVMNGAVTGFQMGGIAMQGVTDVTINGISAQHNAGAGITFSNVSQATIELSNLSYDDEGISASGGQGIHLLSNITSHDGTGIDFANVASSTIEASAANYDSSAGLALCCKGITVEATSASFGGKYGFSVSGSNTTVIGNIAVNDAAYGFYDSNSNCGSNVYKNNIGTGNQSCDNVVHRGSHT